MWNIQGDNYVQEKQVSKHSWLLSLHWPLLYASRFTLILLSLKMPDYSAAAPRAMTSLRLFLFFFLCEYIIIVAYWELIHENTTCLVLSVLLVLIHLIFAANLWGGYTTVTTLPIVAQWGHHSSPKVTKLVNGKAVIWSYIVCLQSLSSWSLALLTPI